MKSDNLKIFYNYILKALKARTQYKFFVKTGNIKEKEHFLLFNC